MKARSAFLLAALLLLAPAASSPAADGIPADPGWPRVIEKAGKQLTIYQPQVDSWQDYKKLSFRSAIAVKTSASAPERYGVVEIAADTVVDHDTRVVAVIPTQREVRFPNIPEAEAASLRRVVDELHPPRKALNVSLDRILAYLEPDKQARQKPVDLNLDPPRIFYSQGPAILVMFMGEPVFKPVQADKPDFMFAVNTNWDIFFDSANQRYYLLDGESWLTATDPQQGPWAPASALPKALYSLPADENWADVRANLPGKPAAQPPMVFVSLEPAEIIVTEGDPSFSPIPGTKLMRVANTDAVLFRDSGDKKYYFLAAGRWFRAASLAGPWSAASRDLPRDFARIPDNSPSAFVKASVPGTVAASDAVLLASIPRTAEVSVTAPVELQVIYSGDPQFQPIQGTTVQYAVNTPQAIFLVNGGYYCCNQGVWYCGGTASGPWAYCTSVPQAIYAIPPSSPMYNVTYVTVQQSTPTTVVYQQTAGYSGEYVAATGVLMFGAGLVVGAAIANNHHHDYYYHYPAPYSYGCGARYNYAYGGYYRAGSAHYGPYGGAGAAASYNPRTGTYSRGAYAYGPAGSASARSAYNPYTGARARGGQVSTPYGSAGRAAAYNPTTGNAARAGYRSGPQGSAAAVQTNRGTGAAAWDTSRGQGAVAKGAGGNVYAGKDGTVYKRDSGGDWSKNSGNGWDSVNRSQAQNNASRSANRQNLEYQAQARQRGNELSQRANTPRTSGGNRGSRGGGGRRAR
ncbi:MAG: hypothetical protein KQJ78_22965 [Deltaproteobacteria bacterium]|nr:hypothetical protein [Deltaproteobacteria bacterium]